MDAPTATAVTETPPFSLVFLKGWKQQPFSEHLALLQRTVDNPGVDAAHIEKCVATHEKYVGALPNCPAQDVVWQGLYRFKMPCGAIVGILIPKKVSDFASERHCAVFVREGDELPNPLEINMLLRDLGADIEE